MMKAGSKSGCPRAAATVVLAILPLCASAQTEEISWRTITPSRNECDLQAEFRGRTALDVLAGLPNGILAWITGGLRPEPDRDEVLSMVPLEDQNFLSRLLTCPIAEAPDRPFDELVSQFLTRERRYFARFQDSPFPTAADEACLEDIDSADLMEDQRDILFALGRKLCSGSIGLRLDDRLRDEAFDIARWHPVDFMVAPAVVAGYLYVLGWDKKVDLLGLRCVFQIEPMRHILERFEGSDADMVSAASMEIAIGRFPVKAIVSFGIMDGDALIDFLGIGTSLGKVKEVVALALSSLRGDE